MLDTALNIGQKLRAAPDGLKHHRFVKKAPMPDEKNNPVRFWRVPVEADGSFDFGHRATLDDENWQKRLFYLNYKKSDADSTKPYIFGDVYRTITKIGEDGNFRFGDPAKKSWMALNSFQRAEEVEAIPTERVKAFRTSFRKQMAEIETFLRDNPNVYIHFDFGGKGWHELEELEALNQNLLDTFFAETEHGYIVRAALYKTLAAGTSRTPGFIEQNQFKNRVFSSANQAMDLLYGVNYSSRRAVKAFDVKIVVLPRGENLTAKQIERFFERNTSSEPSDDSEEAEAELRMEAQDSESDQSNATEEDELIAFFSEDDEQTRNILQFDFIFSKAGGTKADVDMIEIAGLERSKLSHVAQRLREKRNEVEAMRQDFFLRLYGKPPKKAPQPLRITQSFLNVLGDATRAKKKYQSHLFRVLPEIYTESYFQDPVLLPALIEKTEFNIRNDAPNFHFLKFDYYFLTRLQNYEGNRLMEMQESPSYRVGALLGKLAKQFAGPSSPIKSFEKNYVGLLSRRITTLADVVQLANDINQKLVMHDLSKYTFRTSSELAEEIKSFPGRYDKNECAFGFFESYFAPLPPKGEGGDASDSETPAVTAEQ